jgi:hypothetical protein
MTRRCLPAVLLALLLACGGAAPAAYAAATDGADAARQAAAMTGGRVLDVRTTPKGGRVVYEVKVLLDDGRVRVVRIDGTAAGGGSR